MPLGLMVMRHHNARHRSLGKHSRSELQDLQERLAAGSLRLDELEAAYITPPELVQSWYQVPVSGSTCFRYLFQLIDGVLFLSGDRHFAELTKRDRPDSYPLFELTTSPLSAGPYRPTEDAENPGRVPGTLVQHRRNYAILEVDGLPAERRLTMILYESGGREMWRRTLYASDLLHAEVVD